MAIGLSRRLNLSEKNLNLNEALQKLYAPGIQNDINLFSLSSQIKSFINSGKEATDGSQIIALRSEIFLQQNGNTLNRTKFLTKDLTYSTNDRVYFGNFNLSPVTSASAINPNFSKNGSIPAVKIIYPGQGYYFIKTGTLVVEPQKFETDVKIKNVVLTGKLSKSKTARATISFKVNQDTTFLNGVVSTWKVVGSTTVYSAGDTASGIQGGTNSLTINANGSWSYISTSALSDNISVEVTFDTSDVVQIILVPIGSTGTSSSGNLELPPKNAPEYLTKWTGFYTKRFYIDSLEITNAGSNYLIGEDLEIDFTGNVIEESTNASCKIVKQEGEEYFGKNAIIVSDFYYYTVVGASQSGFYLRDENLSDPKFIYLDQEKDTDDFVDTDPKEIRILRNDSISVNNLLQLRFTGSPSYLYSYGGSYSIGDSITGAIYALSATASNLREESYRAIQNTKRPTFITSNENYLGFEYNKIVGQNMDIWQRVVIRDQDFVLGESGVSGINLASSVENFELATGETTKVRVPGLFIKVGDKYQRAYSTEDKPYFQPNITKLKVLNPNIDTNSADYALYAANLLTNGNWYAYNTTISKFAQRLHSNGKDGAFYFHKTLAPTVTSKTSGSVSYYEVPLFTFVP